MGYTKLFDTLIGSTIWREDDATRIVWITMLALADKRGHVAASIPGLADFAKKSIEETEKALANLKAPDAYSRTKEHEGRRIEDIDGGWRLLNHAKYREKMGADERREYLKQKQREHRDRKKKRDEENAKNNPPADPGTPEPVNNSVNNGQQESTLSTHADADANADAVTDTERESTRARARARQTEQEAIEGIREAYPYKTHQPGARHAIQSSMNRGANAIEMLNATKACAKIITEAEARAGGKIRWVPNPENFFQNEIWREPDRLAEMLKPKRNETAAHRTSPATGYNAPTRYAPRH